MLAFAVPKDPPPLGLLFESVVLDDLAYTTGSFDAYVDTSRDYASLQSPPRGLLLGMFL